MFTGCYCFYVPSFGCEIDKSAWQGCRQPAERGWLRPDAHALQCWWLPWGCSSRRALSLQCMLLSVR